MFGVGILKYLNNTSILLHSAGVFSLAVAIVAAAPTHRSAKEVFATFYDGTGVDAEGWSQRASPAYVAICGVLLSQYTVRYHQVAQWLLVRDCQGRLRRADSVLQVMSVNRRVSHGIDESPPYASFTYASILLTLRMHRLPASMLAPI